MDTVCISQGYLNLGEAYVTSNGRPSALSRTEDGMEGGLCMATRAFLKHPVLPSGIKQKISTMDACARLMMRGIKASKEGCGACPHSLT